MRKTKDDSTFERMARRDVARLRADDWDNAIGLWAEWDLLQRATRIRLLLWMLRLCHRRGEGPPRSMVLAFEGEFKRADRGRSDVAGMKRAARYLARNPGASLGQVSKAASVPKGTIQGFFERDAFWRMCGEAARVFDLDRASSVLEVYEEQFWPLDYGNQTLAELVPAMLDAIEGRTGPIDPDDMRQIRRRYRDSMTSTEIRVRLQPVWQRRLGHTQRK